MAKPTFIQRVLGRPSQRYYHTATDIDPEHTNGCRGTTAEFVQSTIDPPTIDTDIDDQFFTPASSPLSSNQNSPLHTPPHSAASSSASLTDNIRPSQSLPDHSTTVNMISVIPASPRKHPPDRKLTYTDEDWTRDVRWLVAPPIDSTQKHKSKSAKRRSAPPTVPLVPSSASSMQSNSHHAMHPPPSRHPPPPRPAKMKALGKAKISAARTVIGMTALLEVEEDLDHDSSLSHTLPTPQMSAQRRSLTAPRHSVESSRTDHRPRVSSPLSSPKLTRRRSLSSPDILLPADEGTSKPTSRTSNTDASSSIQHRAPSTSSRPLSTFTASTSKSPYTVPAPNVLDALAAHVSASESHDALPSSGTRGYSGLVLPRAATSPALALNYNPKRTWKLGKGRPNGATVRDSIGFSLGLGDQVDLSRAGLAQTTMASVEIVRGIAASSGADRKAHKSRGSIFGMGWLQKDKSSSKANNKVHNADTDTPLGFTAYRAPPVYVGGGSVLVQVWGVGLDGTDARLAGIQPPRAGSSTAGAPYGMRTPKNSEKDKGRSPPVGYIPGRSFVGRVLEVGWEVGEDVAKRGDWVVGLMSVHKCGALAEFILADRHRVHRIPNPLMRSKYPFASSSTALNEVEGDTPKRREPPVFPIAEETLSINELALVPLCGVPAFRGVRTFHQITQSLGRSQLPYANSHHKIHPLLPPRSDKHDFNAGGGQEEPPIVKTLDSRPRALILRAHDGAGAFAAQMLIHEGWSIWAHVPVPFMLPGSFSEVPDELKDEEEEKELDNQRNMLRRIEERLRGWGVDEVLFVPVTSMPLSALFDASNLALEGITTWSSPSIHFPLSASSSPSISPSPFSRSATSSPLSSPYSHVLSSGHFSCASPPSSSSHQHAFTSPYSFTRLPLAPYNCEQGSIVSLISYLNRSRVRLDAILDTIGGREIWEAGRSLLSRPVHDPSRQDVDAQFTTLVGDSPDRVVSTAGDNFRAGVRSLRLGGAKEQHPFEDSGYHETVTHGHGKDKKTKLKPRPVNYSWVNVVSDIDWEGSDVHDTLCAVLRLAETAGVRPVVGPVDFPGAVGKEKGKKRAVAGGVDGVEGVEEVMVGKVIPFENTPQVFIPGGGLDHGGTIVSRVAG